MNSVGLCSLERKDIQDRTISYSSLEKETSKDFHRQDIEDMLLLLIQKRMEDLQLEVKSYQKKINLTRPDTYHSDLRRMTPYTTYPDIQGIIYEDEMKRNHLMRTNEPHKFSDGTLNHVRIDLNDISIGIEM
nr:hypothetical protein [Tanacetum cinerariifolium]